MSRWKLFLILILAVVLFHILIIKIFIIGSGEDKNFPANKSSQTVQEQLPAMPEPQMP